MATTKNSKKTNAKNTVKQCPTCHRFMSAKASTKVTPVTTETKAKTETKERTLRVASFKREAKGFAPVNRHAKAYAAKKALTLLTRNDLKSLAKKYNVQQYINGQLKAITL